MLNEALRLIRVFHDLNAAQLARKLKISPSYLSEIENGRKNVSLELVDKYSRYFNLPNSTILFFGEKLRERRGYNFKWKLDAEEKAVTFMRLIDRFDESRI